jgi:hypothetical protein
MIINGKLYPSASTHWRASLEVEVKVRSLPLAMNESWAIQATAKHGKNTNTKLSQLMIHIIGVQMGTLNSVDMLQSNCWNCKIIISCDCTISGTCLQI